MFRAYDATRERLVAVKLFNLDLPPERGHQLVAELELLVAADLTHPALASALATGISGVSAFLVQDYVAADSLDLAVREYGPAPAGNALRVAAQLAGALDFAAAAQLTHGALHPRDVLLSSDDTRLTGLGVTRALERVGVVAPVRRPYTAPERIAGSDWDRRADVFSLAALMHELMWGRRVSGLGARAAEKLTEIAGASLPALRDVFAQALAENPADRFETALEFADALKNACPDVAVAPEPAPAPKRRAVRDKEPRLPLDEGPEEEAAVARGVPDVAQGVPPPLAVDPDELRRGSPKRDAREGGSPADLDISTPAISETEIVYQPAAEVLHGPVPFESAAASPAGFITGRDSEPSALERTRSAVWPLVLALLVGIAIGFAGGFFAGSREQPAAAPAATTAAAAPAAREVAKSAVPAAPPSVRQGPSNSALRTQNSERSTQKSERRTQSAQPKNPQSNPQSNPRSNPQSAVRNPQSQGPDGRLLVRSRPAGAHVTVDGKDYGQTPTTVRGLARGAHHVTIAHDGYAPEQRRFVVTSSRPAPSMTVALARNRAAAPSLAQAPVAPPGRFVGALAVDSRPAGANVFMDGTLVGTTPMALPSVPAGSHAIRLEYDGYRHWSSSVRVVASEQNRVTASLER